MIVLVFSFNDKVKTNLLLGFSTLFFLALISCIIFNYADCGNGNIAACEILNKAIIN